MIDHREVIFYHFHNTYYTTLLTYPREIKIVKIPPPATSWDRSSRRDSHPSFGVPQKCAIRLVSRGGAPLDGSTRVASSRGVGSSWMENSSRNTSRDVKDVSCGRALCASRKPVVRISTAHRSKLRARRPCRCRRTVHLTITTCVGNELSSFLTRDFEKS